jgi:plastocyanin
VRQRKTALCSLLLLITSCGGGSGPATGPDPAASSEPTVNVTARGFEPPNVTVAAGGRVRFQNLDDRTHSIASNPIDTHTDCPPINEVGLLVPGQTKTTGRLPEARTCAYHDELSEASQLLTGSITIR